MSIQPDRRRGDHPRLPFKVPVTVQPVASSKSAPLALAENLSGGGVGLRLFEPSEPNREVTVMLHLFNRPALLRAGRIAWIKRDGIPAGAWLAGVAFHNELAPSIVSRLATEDAVGD